MCPSIFGRYLKSIHKASTQGNAVHVRPWDFSGYPAVSQMQLSALGAQCQLPLPGLWRQEPQRDLPRGT